MPLRDMKLDELLEAVAAKTPTPGGGAVAALTCATAAALARMVVNFSIGKKSLASHEALHRRALESLRAMADRALALADADAAAYARLNELWKLDKDDARRQREMPPAVEHAIEQPRKMLDDALALQRLLMELTGRTSASLNSDLAIAAVLGDAATRAAAWNVRINLPLLNDHARRDSLIRTIDSAVAESRRLCDAIESACAPPG